MYILQVLKRLNVKWFSFLPSDETVRSDCNLASGNIMQNNSETSLNIPSSVTPGLNNTAWNRQQAVCVRNAFKTYGSSRNPNHILQNLNMTVAKGSMWVSLSKIYYESIYLSIYLTYHRYFRRIMSCNNFSGTIRWSVIFSWLSIRIPGESSSKGMEIKNYSYI